MLLVRSSAVNFKTTFCVSIVFKLVIFSMINEIYLTNIQLDKFLYLKLFEESLSPSSLSIVVTLMKINHFIVGCTQLNLVYHFDSICLDHLNCYSYVTVSRWLMMANRCKFVISITFFLMYHPEMIAFISLYQAIIFPLF